MPGPPRPTFPSNPSEPSIRRLGVRSSTNIERPIRAQVVIAAVVALLLLAIPLYLLRSPRTVEQPPPTEAPLGFSPSVPAGVEKKEVDERFNTEEVVRVKCSSGPTAGGKTGRLCDQLPFFEQALTEAIAQAVDCAPRTGEKGSLNYVLTIDFNQKRMHVFPGASGVWKGPQARRATQCVKRALKAPDWEKVTHNHAYYEIAILTHYTPPAPTAAPLFE